MLFMNNIIKRDDGRQPVTFGSVVDQIFQNNLDRFFDEDYWTPGFSGRNRGTGNVPVNIRETDKSYEMELYAPGLNKSDFEKGWFRQEYKMQSFSRSFSMGDTVDSAKIAARYENGVLYLQLPKKEHAQKISRTVEIK
jgi:HSP20 family protein